MPELINLKTSDWELNVWCSDISKRQDTLKDTLTRRDFNSGFPSSDLRFLQPIKIETLDVCGLSILDLEKGEEGSFISLGQALFFENCQYQFEWVFFKEVSHAELCHKLKIVNDSFQFRKRNNITVLKGTINTGNELGWFALPFQYKTEQGMQKQTISFEVLPVKMDLHSDLPSMYKAIDKVYPLWRFKLFNKTQQTVGRGQNRGQFELLWLAYFEDLRDKMMAGLKVIANSPHSRLQTVPHKVKADRLKGRISHKLVEKIKQDFAQGLYQKRYQQNRKKLSVDTPENRFIKKVVKISKDRLEKFHSTLLKNNQAPDNQIISNDYLDKLKSWQAPFTKFQKLPFLNEVGEFTGLSKESLVLQQKTGYSTVYRVWQELKFYLDAFAGQSSVSMKSVAEIYEVWCFLELRRIIVEDLGFNETNIQKAKLELKEFEYRLKDGMGAAFKFKRSDGVKLSLAHEPNFRESTKPIRTWQLSQKPDIVVKVACPDTREFIWIFDAKYRIKSENKNNVDSEGYDEIADNSLQLVPEDAINQMHRYRDALIYINKDNSNRKSRPICGAFALYPGYFTKEQEENPYQEAIEEIGIGAFPLLPSKSGNGSRWVKDFLISQIGLVTYDVNERIDNLYVQESARIPYHGMKQVLYPDLTMTIALGASKGRDSKYFSAFEEGHAKWYHIPESTFKEKYKQHVVNEIRYLALAMTSKTDPKTKEINKVWPVKSVALKSRKDLTKEQAGKVSFKEDLYYLFEIGKPLTIKDAVYRVPHRPIRNTMRLCTLSLFENTHKFSDLQQVYKQALT